MNRPGLKCTPVTSVYTARKVLSTISEGIELSAKMTDIETKIEKVTADKDDEARGDVSGSQTVTRMNPSSWSNPPPPGIDVDEESRHSSIIDAIDPYIKNPEYVRYKKSRDRRSSRSPRRSRSHDRKRRYRSRSRSRGSRRRRSRSRRRSTRSRSSSHDRHRHRRRRKRSRRRSRSRHDKVEPVRSPVNDPVEPETAVEDEDDEPDTSKENAFKNDGSFLEMFKRMQEEQKAKEQEASTSGEPKKPPLPAFGKRRGGRVLKTGMVEKTKACEDDGSDAQDPWSIYLKEVKKYKEACCDDDSKTRPLVK